MHIHGTPLNVSAASFQSSEMEERAAARRAAEARKRLLKAGESAAAEATPEETLLISQWMDGSAMDSRHSEVLTGDEYHTANNGRDPDLG
jgi:hypothetical protein